MTTAITVENLGKKYILSHQKRERYTALRDVMAESVKKLGKRIVHPFSGGGLQAHQEEFWALKGVSFDVKQGDRVGIIGRNGAGKSTLLKVLSRITEPTEGSARIKGRVSSLLEVGTGFHPELTGRENIFLNGAILGMSKAEIKKKFDEIVEFAEVEKFLDTPVKRYSSGMYVRLAFAVAAHLEPEILIVDEVLAVGDAQFQKKCLGKMQDVGKEGRTVLFVSHNMAAIRDICNTGLLITNGQLEESGSISSVVHAYVNGISFEEGFRDLSKIKMRAGNGEAKLLSCMLLNKDERTVNEIASGENLKIQVRFIGQNIGLGSYLAVHIHRFDNIPVFALYSHREGLYLEPSINPQFLEVEVPQINLFPSMYTVKIGINDSNNKLYDYVDTGLTLNVTPGPNTHPSFCNPSCGLIDQRAIWTRINQEEIMASKSETRK